MPRIDEMDERLRAVESAVVELATMARMLKVAVIVMCASLGVDIQGMI
tara:strand:+ start:167 stop:310 length:144 start_codon:yes stop_codon:yes gene_type:complete